MKMPTPPPCARPVVFRNHKQRGVAVITALLLTTLAITIVTSLFWQQQVQVRTIENQRLRLQNEWILRGALDWAALILREDAKHSKVDSLDEPWAVSLAETRLDQYTDSDNGNADTEVTDATLSGSISDAQARYNLTNLCPNGTIDPAEVAVFERLLANAKLDPALAQATANEMAASFGKPAATATNGSQPIPQPMNLYHSDDLLAVPGFTPEALDKLKEFVIFLPRIASVNVNTASAEVLAARIASLSLSDAAALVTSRKTAYFRDVPSDFTNRLQGKSLGAASGKISVTTDYFLVNGKVHMSRAGLGIQALLERNGSNTPLIWIREN